MKTVTANKTSSIGFCAIFAIAFVAACSLPALAEDTVPLKIIGWTLYQGGTKKNNLSDSQLEALKTEMTTNKAAIAYLTGFKSDEGVGKTINGYEMSLAKIGDDVVVLASNAGYGETYLWDKDVFELEKEFDVRTNAAYAVRSLVLRMKNDSARRFALTTCQAVWFKSIPQFTDPLTSDLDEVKTYIGSGNLESWFVGYSTKVMSQSSEIQGEGKLASEYEKNGFKTISAADNFKLFALTNGVVTKVDIAMTSEGALNNATVSWGDSSMTPVTGSAVTLNVSYVPAPKKKNGLIIFVK